MTHSIKTIRITEFTKLAQQNKPIVVDVRTAAEINNEYYEGALNLPVQNTNSSEIEQCLQQCDYRDNDPVYLLCASGQRARKIANKWMASITNPIIVIEGGITAMKQEGVTLKKGPGNVISLDRQVRITTGALVLISAVLGTYLNSAFYSVGAFIGVGLVFAGITNTCGMAMLLARMPWNRKA